MNVAGWIEIGQLDDLGRLVSPVHRLDARIKAVTTLLFLAAVMSFPRYTLSALMPFVAYPLILMAAGRIPASCLLRKLLVAAPFAVLLGMFNPWLDRAPALVLGPLTVTGGWLSFLSILVRFVLTVSAALVLVACTGMYRLAAALERLGVPQVFVMQLLFLYRYLFVVADEGARMRRAVALRAGGRRAMSLRVYGSLVGRLLMRSMDRAQRVHRAMLARGFDGEVRLGARSRVRAADWAFLAGWAAWFAAARTWNLAALVGRLAAGGLS